METNRQVVKTDSKEDIDLEQLMKSEVLEIFPALDKVPQAIATKFQDMIYCYLLTKQKSPDLNKLACFRRVGEVFDDQDRLVCYFKNCHGAKTEAAVYLLDHPVSSHRSTSSDLFGLGGAPPTVYIRTKETSGCLVSFVENDGVVGDYTPFVFKTVPPDINRISIFHTRFGNADCHNRNTLCKKDAEGIYRLTPIDHEECFSANYALRRVWWADIKEATEAFTPEMVTYVDQLNVDRDIDYLKSCGWQIPPDISIPFHIFTFFLKKSVSLHFTPSQMVVLAQNSHRLPMFNLPNMVLEDNTDVTHEDFMQKALKNIDARLTEFGARFLKKSH